AALEAAEAEEEPEQQDEIALLVIDERGDPVAEAAEWIAFAAHLAAVSARRGMPLWLVTRGAQHADPTGDPDLVGAALWGFARVLLNEMPRLSLHLVDFAPSLTEAECTERLAAELTAQSPESEIVWTPAGRHVLRLRPGFPPPRPRRPARG